MAGATRSAQGKTGTRVAPIVLLHSREDWQDGKHIITLSIDGARWEYALTPTQADTVEYLCKHISARKALAFARSRSTRQIKL